MKKWILIASEGQGKIFQKSPTSGISYVGSVCVREEFVKTIANFINENQDRFQFLTVIFPNEQLTALRCHLAQEVLAKLTPNIDDFF